MLKRILPYLFGFLGGALIAGGIESRLWSGRWGGDGACVVVGVLISVGTLIIMAALEDGDL